MNLKTTLALLVLLASGAGLVWLGTRERETTADAGSRAALEAITPASLKRVEIKAEKGTTVLTRTRDGKGWEMPGGWPVHPAEVSKLIALLTNLRSRFAAEPIASGTLKETGLDSPAVTVTVETTAGKTTLALAEAPAEEGATRFDRPTFVRVDDRPEVLRLAPGLVTALNHPSDLYQQRRLLPSRRVPREEGASDRVDRADAREVELREWSGRRDRTPAALLPVVLVAAQGPLPAVAQAAGTFPPSHERTIRLAGGPDDWHLAAPYRDPSDPEPRNRFLEGLADVWVEKFLPAEQGRDLATLGLSPPQRTIVVRRTDGTPVTLHVGDAIREREPDKLMPTPGDTRRSRAFARLENHDRVFEISYPPGSLDPSLDQLRDDQVARFSADDARELTITTAKGTFTLRDTAERPARSDGTPVPAKWRLVTPYEADADSAAVSAVVTALSGLNATRRAYPHEARLGWAVGTVASAPLGALPALGQAWLTGEGGARRLLGVDRPAATIVVTVEEGKGDAPKKRRQLTVRLGHHDPIGKKLLVTAGDWPRINEVSDGLATQVLGKSAMDFRGKRMLSVAATAIRRIEVQRFDPAVVLALGAQPGVGVLGAIGAQAGRAQPVTLERTTSGWEVTAPVRTTADPVVLDGLLERLAQLDAMAFIADKPPADRLHRDYGLAVPSLRVKLLFNDNSPPRTLLIGKERHDGPGWFAMLQGSGEVFTIAASLRDDLARNALGYRPAALWTVARDAIERLKIARAGQEPYELVRKGDDWQVEGPFQVAAPREVVDRLLQSLTAPRADEHLTHATTDKELSPFGLDKPAVQVTVTTKDKKSHTVRIGAATPTGPIGRFAWQGGTSPLVVVSDRLARAVDQSALDFLDRQLVKFTGDQATALTRLRGKDTLALEKKDDAWRLVKPADQAADSRKVPELLKLLGELRATRIVDYNPKAPAKYGLDKPEATLTVKLAEGAKPAEYVVRLGGGAGGGGERYAQVAGSPFVGVLAADTVKQLLAGPLAFRDHDLARVPDADTIKLEAGPRKVTFARPEGTWVVSQPAKLDADNDAVESNLLGTFAPLRADAVVEKPTAAQLKGYGLDKPARRWQLLAGEKVELELEVGATEKGGARRYARVKGGELVFLLSPRSSLVLMGEYRPRTVFKSPIDPAQITRVNFKHAKDGFELTKDGTDWEVDGKPDVKLNAATVSDTLAVLRELKLERYVADAGAQLKDFGLDPPALVLEVTTPDGKQVLHVGGLVGTTKQRYSHLPASGQKDVFVLDEATSAKLFRDTKALARPLSKP